MSVKTTISTLQSQHSLLGVFKFYIDNKFATITTNNAFIFNRVRTSVCF